MPEISHVLDDLVHWLTDNKLPFGPWMKTLIGFIQTYGRAPLDLVREELKIAIEGLATILKAPPPLIVDALIGFLFAGINRYVAVAVFFALEVLFRMQPDIWHGVFDHVPPELLIIAAFAMLAWTLHRGVMLTVFVAAALIFILNQGYWGETMDTLALVVSATLACVIIGVPLGIVAAHKPGFYAVLRPILDIMQTLPTFVYLVPTLVLFGLGVVPGLFSTLIFALAAPIRMTRLGVASVPKPLIEAGLAFGATRWQLLWKVELPSALPSIMAGINQCIMLSLSMVVIAALVGAGGLGKPVVRALNTVNVAMGFEAGFAIVLLAIIIDRIAKSDDTAGGGK